jgi:hypothetical protein
VAEAQGVLVGAYYDGWLVRVDIERRHLRIEPPPGEAPVVYEYAGTGTDGRIIFKAGVSDN